MQVGFLLHLAPTSVLDKLVERSKLFNFANVYLYLFAKTGFTKGCIDKATELGNVELITFEMMNS